MAERSVIGPVTAILVLSAAAMAVAQESPRIFAGANGEIEATFTNNCVVYYNSDGRRTRSNNKCSRSQVTRADKGVADYRREQGGSGYSNSEAPPGGFGGGSDQYANVPEVFMDDHGRSHVNVGNHCTVYFDRQGRYNDTSGNCSRTDRNTASNAIAAYRREQGEAQRSSAGTYVGVPVYHFRNGNYQASFTDGCIVYFKPNGIMYMSTQKCDSDDKARAALAVYEFRREHGTN